MGRKVRRSIYDPSIMENAPDSFHEGSGSGGAGESSLNRSSGSGLALDPLSIDYNADADADFMEGKALTPVTVGSYEDEYQHHEILDPRLHKLQTAQKRNKCRRYTLLVLVGAGFVAIVTTVAVILSRNANKNNSSGSGASREFYALPAPPSSLQQTCSMLAASTGLPQSQREDALLKCEEGCAISECCDLTPNFDLSCLKGNEQVCMEYNAACHILMVAEEEMANSKTDKKVPAAPAYITDVCAINNLLTNTGVRKCANACVPNTCCWEQGPGIQNCQAANPTTCPTYAPCLNLRATDTVHTKITEQIDDHCLPVNKVRNTWKGRRQCRNTCKVGFCCFTKKGCAQKGPEKGAEFCAQYKGCSVLHDPNNPLPKLGQNKPNQTPKYDDDDEFEDDDGAFTGDDLDDDGYDDDYVDDEVPDDDFVDDDAGIGDQYEDDDEVDWEDYDDDFAQDLDDDDALNIDPDDGADNYDNDSIVGQDGGGDLGDEDQVFDIDEDQFHPTLEPIPTQIADVCEPTTINSGQNKASCAAICSKANCCDFPERLPQSCLAGNHLQCLDYHKYCAVLSSVIQPLDSVVMPPAPADLHDLCSTEHIATPEGMQNCTAICNPSKCCWEIGSSYCADHPNCPGYAPCFNLRTTTDNTAVNNIPEAKTYIDTVCTPETVQTVEGRAQCNSACLHQSCCLHGADTCYHKSQAICDQFSGCELLFDDATDPATVINTGHKVLPPPPDNLDEICSQDSLACREFCDVYECCKVPENLAASCLLGNHVTCLEMHRSCSNAELGTLNDATVNIPVGPNNLGSLCSSTSLSTRVGRTKCRTVCNRAKCCFSTELEPDVAPCRTLDVCTTYAACLNLEASNTVQDAIASEIDQKCTVESALSPEGKPICQSVCQQHRCCFADDDVLMEECYEDTSCAQYDGCDLVFGDNSNTP